MKTTILILAAATMLSLDNSTAGAGGGGGFGARGRGDAIEPLPQEALDLPRFNLEFAGGTPGLLVQAIEKASGKTVNAIIPVEYGDIQLPPLKLRSVNVPELFQALMVASQRRVNVVTGTFFGGGGGGQPSAQYQQTTTYYGFKTVGIPREDSIWTFFSEEPPQRPEPPSPPIVPKPRVCRFFQLRPYLENHKIEDITTAVETGWKMLGSTGDSPTPQISFHKDTKLLIAVGDPEKLKLIDSVLEQLELGPAGSAPKPGPAANEPAPQRPARRGGEPQQP